MKYDYYGLKSKLDDFLDLHDEEIVKQGWTITSKPCNDCKDYNINLRYSDPKYYYETTSGVKKYNLDYLFVEKIDKNKKVNGPKITRADKMHEKYGKPKTRGQKPKRKR